MDAHALILQRAGMPWGDPEVGSHPIETQQAGPIPMRSLTTGTRGRGPLREAVQIAHSRVPRNRRSGCSTRTARGWGWPVMTARAVATACRSALLYVVVAGPVVSGW